MKVNIHSQYDPAIPLLGMYPREMKAYVNIKICTQMFTGALFIVTKNWKPANVLSTGE